jgi:hypothetical protein
MKIVVFSPYSYIKEWRFMDLYLASVLNGKSNEIIFLECNGYQETCVAMLSAGLSWDSQRNKKNEICSRCKYLTRITSNIKNTIHVKLDSFLTQDDDIISSFLQKNKINQNFTFRGIKIGEAVLYSLLIENQYTDFSEVRQKNLNDYVQELKTGIKTVLAGTKFFEIYKPEILLLHNGLYATGNILAQLAKIYNCDVYCHTNGSNRQSFDDSVRIAKGNYYEQIDLLKSMFNIKTKVSSKDKKIIQKHLDTLQKAKTLYKFSAEMAGNIPEWLKNKIKSRKMALLSLSSYDELIGAKILGFKQKNIQKHIFSNQIEWVKKTIKFFAKNPSLFLIVRPHPREFPNPRTRSTEPTKHIKKMLCAISKKLPKNVFINLPQDNISIYDLLKRTRCLINGWSSAGEEAALIGKNIITVFPAYANYPENISNSPKNKKDYFAKILQQISKNKKNLKNIRSFEKWKTFSINQCEVATLNFKKAVKSLLNIEGMAKKIISIVCPKYYIKNIRKELGRCTNKKIRNLITKKNFFLFEE